MGLTAFADKLPFRRYKTASDCSRQAWDSALVQTAARGKFSVSTRLCRWGRRKEYFFVHSRPPTQIAFVPPTAVDDAGTSGHWAKIFHLRKFSHDGECSFRMNDYLERRLCRWGRQFVAEQPD